MFSEYYNREREKNAIVKLSSHQTIPAGITKKNEVNHSSFHSITGIGYRYVSAVGSHPDLMGISCFGVDFSPPRHNFPPPID
jgi:hypothetical protein